MTINEINQVVRDHVGPATADWVTLTHARQKLRMVRRRLDRLAEALEAPLEHARFLAESGSTISSWDLYVLDHIARIGAALECEKQKNRQHRPRTRR